MSELILDPREPRVDLTIARDRGLEALVDRLFNPPSPSNVVRVQFGSRTVAQHLERQDSEREHIRLAVQMLGRDANLMVDQQRAAIGAALAGHRRGESVEQAIGRGRAVVEETAKKMAAIKARMQAHRGFDDLPPAA